MRRTGATTPVEVSLCGQATTSPSGEGRARPPGSAEAMREGSRKGAREVAAANLAENSPNTPWEARSRTREKVAASQKAVEPPLPRITS